MIRRLWSRNRWLLIGFLIAVVLSLFFGVRALLFSLYWSDPAKRDQEIAGWMTPRYVAMSWDVPPEVVSSALDLPHDGTGRRVTLRDLAAERDGTVSDLAAELAAAIAAYRSGQ
jgi:hypothetical protein